MKSFKQFKTQINELFDRPARWKLVLNHNDMVIYTSSINDDYLEVFFQEDEDDVWQVSFSVNMEFEVTGKGNEVEIFSTVLDVMKDFIQKRVPKELNFSAKKSLESSNSRVRLYNRLIKRFAATHGYRLANKEDRGKKVVYVLTKK